LEATTGKQGDAVHLHRRYGVYCQECVGAEDVPGDVGNKGGVIAGVEALEVGNGVAAAARAREVGAVETPLIIQWRGAGDCDAKESIASHTPRLALGLGRDLRRNVYGQDGGAANGGTATGGDDDVVVAAIALSH